MSVSERIQTVQLGHFRAVRLERLSKFIATLLFLSFAVWTVV